MSFAFLEPSSVNEALSLLQKFKGKAKILAGGTDLALKLRRRLIRPEAVLHIGSLQEIRGLRRRKDGSIWIGALSTMAEVSRAEVLQGGLAALRLGASQVASMQVRNMATLGGGLCLGIPRIDTAPALVALEASALLQSARGYQRSMKVEDFFRGRGKTALKMDELLLGLEIPPLPRGTEGVYLKYSPRGTFEWPMVGVAVLLTCDPRTLICEAARMVIGARGPRPFRARKAEALLVGNRIDHGMIAQAAERASADFVRAAEARSDWYLKEMIRVGGKRAITGVCERFSLLEGAS